MVKNLRILYRGNRRPLEKKAYLWGAYRELPSSGGISPLREKFPEGDARKPHLVEGWAWEKRRALKISGKGPDLI